MSECLIISSQRMMLVLQWLSCLQDTSVSGKGRGKGKGKGAKGSAGNTNKSAKKAQRLYISIFSK